MVARARSAKQAVTTAQVKRFVSAATTVSCNTAGDCAARRLITGLSLRCNAWVQALLGEAHALAEDGLRPKLPLDPSERIPWNGLKPLRANSRTNLAC